MNYRRLAAHSRALSNATLALLLFAALGPGTETLAQTAAPRTPTEIVRQFYKAMHEKRFREAFALSIYKPAIEGLSAEEFEELRPDFENMASAIPEKIEVSGEQVSGDIATVFVKIADADKASAEAEPVGLMREGGSGAGAGAWIIGDKENQEIVRKAGKEFFFQARIQTHQTEVQTMLQRINLVEMAYASQHNNLYADLPTLIAAGLVPKDIETSETTGYHFHLTLAKDAKSWTAGAEPVRYGRTGRLSFLIDQTGIRSADTGGKVLILPSEKQ